jgi:PilZ domain
MGVEAGISKRKYECGSMADETDAGAAYLAALKRSSLPQASGAAPARVPTSGAAAPAGTPEAVLSPGRTGPVPEHRRSPRYRCQGSAQLREVNSGTSMWATFSDISMHGCYVEAAAGYPFGSVLALIIEVNGFRAELTGQVKVAYPGLGMGISFTQVSESDSERLRALVRSLSQPSVIMGAKSALKLPPLPEKDVSSGTANAALVVEAITTFFQDRHVMGREEFLRILRRSRP